MFVSKSRMHLNRKIRVFSIREERKKSQESSRSCSDQSACGRKLDLIELQFSRCSSGSRESSHGQLRACNSINRITIETFLNSQEGVPLPVKRKSSSINAIKAAAAEGEDQCCSFGPKKISIPNQSEVSERMPEQDEEECIDLSESTAQELAPNDLNFSQTKNHSKLTQQVFNGPSEAEIESKLSKPPGNICFRLCIRKYMKGYMR